MDKLPVNSPTPSAADAHAVELRALCYRAIDAAKREIDPDTKRLLAARAFALAQEAGESERRANDSANLRRRASEESS
jgi:hypothetical protein